MDFVPKESVTVYIIDGFVSVWHSESTTKEEGTSSYFNSSLVIKRRGVKGKSIVYYI